VDPYGANECSRLVSDSIKDAGAKAEGMYIVPAFGANPLSRDGSDLALYDTKLLTPNGETVEEKQPAPQTQKPFNPTITYDKNFSATDLAAAQSKVGAAVGLINSKWSQLSDQEKATIQNIKAIDVSGTAQRSYVQESTGKLTLRQDYVTKSSTAWLASAVGHDSEHVSLYNSGGIASSRGIPAEVKAMQFQLQVGTKFGLSQVESTYLKGLIQNPSQLQKYINTPP